MVTITETAQRELSTVEEIIDHLRQGYDAMAATSPFAAGDLVDISSRAGIPPDTGIGDVAIFLVSVSGTPWSTVMLLTGGGNRIITAVPTENLTKRDAA
ncbi:hypothetical protein [Methylorubrum zatmanii]